MIQQKLVVGRYLNFAQPLQQPTAGAAPAPFGFTPLQPMPLFIQESTGIFTKTSAVGAGAHATKGHRDFQWLEYRPGYITEVALTTDVLTGPMSGCPIVVFRRNGAITVAHVGTVSSTTTLNHVEHEKDDANRAVLATWNNYAQANQGDMIGGFNPVRSLAHVPPATGNDQSAPVVFGVVTTGFQFYSLVLYPQKTDVKLKRIAALQVVNTWTADQMANLPLPG